MLSDDPRSAAPPKFSPEQVASISALACEPPEDSGVPVVEKICDTYQSAPQLATQGAHVISTDEKTGMQALERLHETKPVRPGLVERVEFEYLRHGTLCLMANFDVVTGQVVNSSIGPTRTEVDFVAHIEQTIDTDPAAPWFFVADQLNTHQSAGLVEMVARPHPFRLHSAPWLVAQPSRNLVLDLGSPPAQKVQLHFARRSPRPRARFHQVLQRRPRQAVPMDLHREAASNMTRGSTSSPTSSGVRRRMLIG